MSKRLKANFLMLFTAMIWGFAFVAQLLGFDYMGALSFNAVRFLIGALSLIPVILIFEGLKVESKKFKHTIIAGVVAGLILFTASTLQQYGIQLTQSAGKAGFITGLYTVIVPFIAVFFGKKTQFNTWIGAVIVVVGLYFLSFSNGISSVGIGDLVLFIGAIMWAMHIIFIDLNGDKIYSLRFAFTQFLTSSILSFICTFIFEDLTWQSIINARYPLLYAGLMSVGIAYTCQIIGQKHADPTSAAIILSFESVFSALGEAVFFTFIMVNPDYVPLTAKNILGCAIMFVGIIISQLNIKNKI